MALLYQAARLAALNLEEPVVLDFGARAQNFLKRITPLSADLAARGRTRTLALQKLHRICLAEVRTLKARYTLSTVKLALSKYRNAIRAVDPDHLVLRPRKMRSGQRFSYLALDPEETRALNAAYHERLHHDQSNLIPLDPEAFIQTALELLASDRYASIANRCGHWHLLVDRRDLQSCAFPGLEPTAKAVGFLVRNPCKAGNLLLDISPTRRSRLIAAVGLSHILWFPGPARVDPDRYSSDCSRED
jgi:hypothetical protein